MVFSAKKRFFKIRYTQTKPDAAVVPEKLPPPLLMFLDALDAALTDR